jgi:hypothetical protein
MPMRSSVHQDEYMGLGTDDSVVMGAVSNEREGVIATSVQPLGSYGEYQEDNV